ncbi:MAG: single-stranded-DNA-specific exonuclease RecJ [Puniceicoccales bacterium]|jgi:single-stranded-DNA-specific exonuclease|nr:single-stranded-DNA-specific exonuclease RecJ [Puniceicoccales bacterium]
MHNSLNWKPLNFDGGKALHLQRLLRIPEFSARLLSARGFADPTHTRRFLDARLSQLEDPFRIGNLRAAVERIQLALERGETVALFGDYDVDGITSTVLMVNALRYFGGQVFYHIPRRFEEGYGLSQAVVERAFATCTPQLALALDCGTNSTAQIEWMRARGATVIVIDHHRVTCPLANDLILVNPNGNGGEDQRNFGIFCTAGLVFKCIHGLLKLRRELGDGRALEFDLKGQLDLVTLATVADVVPLVGENRIFVKYGLKELQHPCRVGTRAIMDQAQLDRDRPPVATDLSFRICPRINASGRIADATLPVEMFLSEDPVRAEAIAKTLSAMNLERQRIESEITEEASRMVERDFADRNSIVLFNKEWHTGVIGIVAGKLMQRYRKPCVVLSREDKDMAKGSGRCVSGLNLVDLLSKCSHLLGSWGGHPLAAGIGMPVANIERFREAFEVRVTEALQIIDVARDLEIAAWIGVGDVNEFLMRQLRQLEPFGQGNPQPIFGLRSVSFACEPSIFGSGRLHFNFTIAEGSRTLHGVAWHRVDILPTLPRRFDLAVKLNPTHWNGNRGIQLEFVDFRPCD